MQIRTAMRYHLTRGQNGHHQRPLKNKWWRGHGEKGTVLHCCKLAQPLWRTVWRSLKQKVSDHVIKQSHSLAYIQRKPSFEKEKIYAPQCSLQL